MLLSLAEVQRIAAEVAAEQSSTLEVVVSGADGDSAYTELILTVTGCAREPCQTVVGIRRDVSRLEVRTILADHLRQHLDAHRDRPIAVK